MDVSKFRDGRVHFKNSGVKGLRPVADIHTADSHNVEKCNINHSLVQGCMHDHLYKRRIYQVCDTTGAFVGRLLQAF